jgi:hypothetical protein
VLVPDINEGGQEKPQQEDGNKTGKERKTMPVMQKGGYGKGSNGKTPPG